MRLIGTLLSLLLAQIAPPAQTAPATPAAPASVMGKVVKTGSGDGVAEVTVELVPMGASSRNAEPGLPIWATQFIEQQPPARRFVALTEEDGRFSIQNVPPGQYRLYATHPNGYLPSEYGQRTTTGTGSPLTLASDQRMSDVTLRMTPTASIGGRITDADGDPVVFASILAFRIAYRPTGERKVEIAQSVLTDDRGDFRMFWLAPGRYYLSAMPIETRQYGLPLMYAARFGGAQYLATPMLGYRRSETGETTEETWAPIYYPGTTDIRTARLIELGPGSHFETSLSMAASPTRTLQLRGVVLDPAGKPAQNAEVTLTPRRSDGHSVVLPRTTTNASGAFTLHGVVPGSYQLTASSRSMSSNNQMSLSGAAVPLEVGNAEMADLKIQTTPAIDIPWRIAFESPADGNSKAAPPDVRLIRQPTIGFGDTEEYYYFEDGPPGQAAPPNVLRAITAGDYRVQVKNLPQGAYIKSIHLGAADVLGDGLHVPAGTSGPLEIVVAANGSTVKGVARDPLDRPLANATIVLLPPVSQRQSRLDLIKTTASGPDGVFRLDGIAPGDYRVFAWEEVRDGDWHDPDFMQDNELRGVPVRVTDADPVEVNAPAIPAERSAQ